MSLLTHKAAEEYFDSGYLKLVGSDDYQDAIQDFDKAIEIEPNYAEAYYYRGNAKQSLDDKVGACLDWGKAAELGYIIAYKKLEKFCDK